MNTKSEVDNYIQTANNFSFIRLAESINRNYADIPKTSLKQKTSDTEISIIDDSFYDKSPKYLENQKTQSKDDPII